MTALERLLTGVEVIDMIEASVVASGVLVCDDDNKEDGFDEEGFEAEAAVSGGVPVVAFEGMKMFTTMSADEGGSIDDTMWTDVALEFL